MTDPRHILDILRTIAPEIEPEGVDEQADLLDAFDIDSMDFLNFIAAVAKQHHIDIPEADYDELRTLAGAARYLDGHGR